MALCFAHAAAGYLVYEAARPPGPHRPGLLVAAIALAVAPDLDFLPGLALGAPGAFHRGVTHTVLAAAVVAAVVALAARLARTRRRPWRVGLFAAAAYGSHLVIDLCSADVVAPHGARFLWPLSDAYYLAPVTPFREIIIDSTGRLPFLTSLLTPAARAVWAGEVALLALAVALVHGMRAWLGPAELPDAGVAEGP